MTEKDVAMKTLFAFLLSSFFFISASSAGAMAADIPQSVLEGGLSGFWRFYDDKNNAGFIEVEYHVTSGGHCYMARDGILLCPGRMFSNVILFEDLTFTDDMNAFSARVNNAEVQLHRFNSDELNTNERIAFAAMTTTGKEIDKFDRFGLTPLPASIVSAPPIKECYANIECRVVDYIKQHNIFVLDDVKAWINKSHKGKRMLHARGDGTFIADGEIFKRRKRMGDKLPASV